MAAIQPVSNDAGCFERRLKAEFRQSIERFMVVGIARKCQRRTLGLRLLFEQPSVVMLHLVQMIEKHGRKCISVLKSEKARKTLELSRSGGRLCVCSSFTICKRCSTTRKNP